jgi:hypothetical protein
LEPWPLIDPSSLACKHFTLGLESSAFRARRTRYFTYASEIPGPRPRPRIPKLAGRSSTYASTRVLRTVRTILLKVIYFRCYWFTRTWLPHLYLYSIFVFHRHERICLGTLQSVHTPSSCSITKVEYSRSIVLDIRVCFRRMSRWFGNPRPRARTRGFQRHSQGTGFDMPDKPWIPDQAWSVYRQGWRIWFKAEVEQPWLHEQFWCF